MRRAIARKRDGAPLAAREWRAAVDAYLAERVDDAQMAALLMASLVRGLDADETRALTEAFVASGETMMLPERAADKHSSGGVGDTASLIVIPVVAACGVPVAKLSGRALGHTGGTLDKLEAVAGVRTDLSPDAFVACVREAGCAIAAQSARLVPADARIYALRDRTATVPSPGLIAASIVSKKIAGGAHAILYDVKVGRGAFMTGVSQARELAASLVTLTHAFGRAACALVTDMNEPLGPAIGTGLETLEARDFLAGERRDPRLAELCAELGATMLSQAGVEDARAVYDSALTSGAGLERFERMLAAQGARPGALAGLQPHASRTTVAATRSGYVAAIDPVALGEAARDAVAASGAGAGVRVLARIGDRVAAGAPLATLYGAVGEGGAAAAAFTIGDEAPLARPLVYFATGASSALRSSEVERSTLEIK